MKLKYLFLIQIFIICFNVFASERYTLKELLQIANERSDVINITREEKIISTYDKRKAISSLIPDVALYGGHREYTESKKGVHSIELPANLGVFEYETYTQPSRASTWGVRLDQNYSLGGREFIGISIASKNIKRSKYEIERVAEEYLMAVVNAYFAVLISKRNVEIAEENRIRLESHRKDALKRYKVGEDTKTVLLRAEAELSGSESDLERAQNNLEYAKIYLARLVGIKNGYHIDEVELKEREKNEIPFLLKTAYENRPEMKQVKLDEIISDKQISYAKSAFFPDLGIEGSYSDTDYDPETMADELAEESAYIGVTLTLPIFEGGFRVADVAQAKARRREASLSYFDTKKTVTVEVKEAYLDLKTERRNLEYYKDQLAFARENYRLMSKQFQVGLASSVDYIDANTLLLTSERQVNNAYYNYQLSIARLEKAKGKLLEYFDIKNKY
ncbi:MAG: TolC family protein [Deferribacterota bacterium]|nr:TolC family protein [Deferribacterota bacterium]